MRVQFTKDEEKLIDERSLVNENSEDIIVPVELQGQVITMGLQISDVHKFNMFLDQYIKDEKIRDQIGASVVHVDFREPIRYENVLFLQTWVNNYTNGLLYGPIREEAPSEDVENIEETSDQDEEKEEVVEESTDESESNASKAIIPEGDDKWDESEE